MINDSGIYSIKIKDQVISLRFAMPANKIIFEKLLEYPEMLNADKIDERGITWLILAGYQNACKAKDEQPIHGYEFFYDFVEGCMVDEGGAEVLQDIAVCYSNSRFTIKAIENINAATEELKKKSQ